MCLNDDDKLVELEKRYNEKLSDLKLKRIRKHTECIQESKLHQKQKYLKRMFLSQNQSINIQNLWYNDEYIERDTALQQFYNKIMNKDEITTLPISAKTQHIFNQIKSYDQYVLFSFKKIKSAIKITNPIGACGYDKITQKHLTTCIDQITLILYLLFNTWSRTNAVPGFVKTGIITSYPNVIINISTNSGNHLVTNYLQNL